MNHKDYAKDILAILAERPATLPPLAMDDGKRGNAGRCMAAMVRHRLAQNGGQAQHVRHSLVEWNGGVIGLRNSRHAPTFWTNISPSIADQLRSLGERQPTVYLFVDWQVEDGIFRAWAVPEDIAFDAIGRVPRTKHDLWSIEISPEDHQVKNAPGAPSFAAFYVRAELTEAERAKLLEAIKTDDSIKQERQAADDEDGSDDETTDDEPLPGFTNETVAFLLELPEHVNDGPWHEANKRRYERVLRDPSQAVVDQLRTRYIEEISPVVAGGKRHLSILKKNDYGKGGYHDHYWFAFYDPAAGSKTKSAQLYVRFLGTERIWRYGFAMGNYCGQYMDRLMLAIVANPKSVADHVRHAPEGTVVRVIAGEFSAAFSPEEFANRIPTAPGANFGMDGALTDILIARELPLDTLPEHSETLVDEIGKYFEWCWPFFDAAMTGVWKYLGPNLLLKPDDDGGVEVEESAPKTIPELAELTALSEEFLEQLQDALLAKQQAILVGPPGTSKTYLARQFARYFVRQGHGRPQGSFEVLYMHANWAYEDFFEGLKPISRGGTLAFEPRLGFFLKWVDGLKDYNSKAVHVLVLDEINRCDTAAVLGELLQLLEYRGTTVQLLSGRSFVFPNNLFIIGTMNSADRSIGRLDLALRRRFLWLDLHPKPDTLNRWLQRPGNNPLGFKADALVRCNELLAEHGIPAEQQIGHALFMLQRTPEDDEASPKLDTPLNEKHLRQVVQFSVLPYVRELLTMQFGQADAGLLRQISDHLLDCVNGRAAGSEQERTDDQPPT